MLQGVAEIASVLLTCGVVFEHGLVRTFGRRWAWACAWLSLAFAMVTGPHDPLPAEFTALLLVYLPFLEICRNLI